MQKIGLSVLENMVRKKVTNRELDFILYIARYQNEYGVVTGVHYKDVCDGAGLSYQGFYDCKRSLEDKGIISCEKNNYFDWDITIEGNSFKGKENYGRGYVSIHCNMVRDPEFRKCKVGSKLLALLLMRDWKIAVKKSKSSSFQILKENFVSKYTGLFGVSKRMVRQYLGELQSFISVYLEEGRKYYLTFKKTAVMIDAKAESENNELRSHDITVACRRNRIKEAGTSVHQGICQILCQQHKKIENSFTYDLTEMVRKSLEIRNQGRKRWKRELSVPLLHKVLVDALTNV